MKKISIISPCFNEEENIEECAAAVRRLFEGPLAHYDYEHIFADNASVDGSVDVLRRITAANPRVKAIINARNYGPFRSTFNALRATSGDAVLVMLAVDLQDPPELLVEFVRYWEEGHKVVCGVRKEREEGFLMRKARKAYYRLINRLADIEIPVDAGEFQLIDRIVVDALKRSEDYYPYIRGMIADCGFRPKVVPYVWRARSRGQSKNRLYHLFDQGMNGLVSFTNLPIRLGTLLGFVLAAVSMLYALVQLIINLVNSGSAQPGIATLIVAIFFFSGVQLAFLGLLGEYIAAIHTQVRRGAVVVESERINFSSLHSLELPYGSSDQP